MKREYPTLLVLPLVTLLVTTGAAVAESEHRLASYAEAAEVVVSPSSRSKRLIRVPELEFAIRVDADCVGETYAQSISISIADTVATHDVATQEAVSADKAHLETTFHVPGRQIAPISVRDFCLSEDESDSGTQTLLIPAAVAANCGARARPHNQFAMIACRCRFN